MKTGTYLSQRRKGRKGELSFAIVAVWRKPSPGGPAC